MKKLHLNYQNLYIKKNNNIKIKENGKENIYLNYEKIIRNGEFSKLIIYENKIQTPKNNDKKEFSIQINEINSTIVRTFNHLGDMTSVEMEGKALFKSEKLDNKKKFTNNKNKKNLRKIEEENERYIEIDKSNSNVGINQVQMDVKSNLQLIKGNLEPNTLLKLNNLSNMINMEIDNSGNKNETNVTNINLHVKNNTSNDTINDTEKFSKSKSDINYLNSYTIKYKILGINFLGLYIGYDQYLYINNKNGLRKNSVNLLIGDTDATFSSMEIYQYNNSGADSNSMKLIDQKFDLDDTFKIFGIEIKYGLYLKCSLDNDISIDIKNGEMYTKGSTEFDLDIEANFGPQFLAFSSGVSLIVHLAKVKSYIEANTLLKFKSDKTLFKFSKNMNSESLDLKIIFLLIDLLVTDKEYGETINLYEGITDYEDFSYYY